MFDFANTPMGRKLFESTLPRIADALEQIAAGKKLPAQDERRYHPQHPIPDSQFLEEPGTCPACFGHNLQAGSTRTVEGGLEQDVQCAHCRRAWAVRYAPVGYRGKGD